MDLSKVAKVALKNVRSGEVLAMEEVWKERTTVFIFFRRWGCLFCRLWARELSEIAPLLRDNSVSMVGVGVDEVGLQEFVDGKFFDGELYVDVNKQVYSAMQFKRFNILSVLASLFSSEARAATAKARAMKLGGDLRGDGLQNGGVLVVSAGGKEVLYRFRQEGPAEHPPNLALLRAVGLEALAPPPAQSTPAPPQCPGDA
ncbi:prostamide/prostaglandin F synthase-like [Bacillus rossius redtenbacheri]|uniref:prostamide/prostaglandin F synthase-like n=1 Tax=Bacillus rossius redtenbacheri TaxID=93214 RepID=UPI002FDD1FEE